MKIVRHLIVGMPMAALITLGSSAISAATITWGGSDGEYTTAANWTGGSVPNTDGGDTAVINGGAVIYTPGGDLPLHSGGVLEINGGSWTQVTGVSWIQVNDGAIHVNGGTFNQGSAGSIQLGGGAIVLTSGVFNASTELSLNSTSSVQVTGGIANLAGNYIYKVDNGSFTLSGSGTVNVGNEFKPFDTFTLSGGTLTVGSLISFSDGPGTFNLSGGTLKVNGANGSAGFYGANAAQGVNFTTGSVGSLFIDNYTTEAVAPLLTNGTIQYNGASNASQFNVVSSGSGVLITAVSAIPEPSTYAALAGLAILGVTLVRRRKQG